MESGLLRRPDEPKIFINNRILARTNGKPISTYDVMKKMDLTFYRHYPEYTSSNEARFQFYQMSWKHVLSEMIDKELILADAKESKIAVTSGDVRQEIESSFGPNVIANLDKAGLSFDEAFKMMHDDLLIRRLMSGRAHAKAVRQVTPNKVRAAYEQFIQDPENARLTQWTYRIITVKEKTLPKSEETARTIYSMLLEGTPPQKLVDKLKERKVIGRKGKVTVSNLIRNNEKEVSEDYRNILVNLEKGMFSQPFAHKSRSTNATVYRILSLEEKIPGSMPTYQEMEVGLKDKLLDDAIDKETDAYLLKLRDHYHVRDSDLDASIPSDYQPFRLN